MVLYIGRLKKGYDPLAQTVEHLTFNQGVRSSSLRWVTKKAQLRNSGVELSFDASDPEVVTMLRRGDISAMMVFDKSNCHRSVYRTPYMNFDLEIRTSAVDNQLLLFGRLHLNYVIDILGISAERNDLTVIISER